MRGKVYGSQVAGMPCFCAVQWCFEVWDSLDELNGRCLNQLGAKRTSGCENGSDSAGPALFYKKKVIFVYKGV